MRNSSDNGNDRRDGRRYALQLPLQFESGSGLTRNVSSAGVLFTTAQPPRAGQRLHCSLQMTDGTTLQFEAVVVRVEGSRDAASVAARFQALSGFESFEQVH